MKTSTYLNFDGRCAEAFDCYARCLNGRITMLTRHGETPMADQVGADWRDKVVHAELAVGDQLLMGSDVPPAMYEAPRGFSVQIEFDDIAEGERAFAALADGGEVRMPFAETFWAKRFGMVVDKFGIPWMFNCARTD
jgi:PhnB protein